MVSANEDYSLYEGKLCNFQYSVSILRFQDLCLYHSIETFIVSSQWIQIYPGHAMNTPLCKVTLQLSDVAPTQDPGSISEWMTASRDLELIQKVKWKLYCCFHYIHLYLLNLWYPLQQNLPSIEMFVLYRHISEHVRILPCTIVWCHETLHQAQVSWWLQPYVIL